MQWVAIKIDWLDICIKKQCEWEANAVLTERI